MIRAPISRYLLFVLAIGLAALGLGSCASTNPLTEAGSRELADDEKRLWNRAGEESRRLNASGQLYEDEALLEYINSVAVKLAPKGLDSASMQVRLLRNPHLNAFAFPHGAIYLHTGIVAKMENEAQLAALIAHEMTHVIHRHLLQHFRTAQNTSNALAVLNLLSLPAGVFGSLASLLGSIGAAVAVTGYSRDMERQADNNAFEMIVDAGYDPTEAPKLFEHLKQDLEHLNISEPFFFGSHPRLSERKANFERMVDQHGRPPAAYSGANEFLEHIAPLLLENARLDIALGRWEWAEEALRRFVRLRPQDPNGPLQLAEVYRRRAGSADLSEAEINYALALKLNADFAPAHRGLGLTYLKLGNMAQARQSFERYLALAPAAADRAYIDAYLKQTEEPK